MKIILFLFMGFICLSLTGCDNEHDSIEVYNKSDWIFDNIIIETKDDYFYESYEKFTVDDNTIGVTIYFSTLKDDEWRPIKDE